MSIDRTFFPADDEGYSWDTIESNPEKAGLEIVASMDAGGGYEFDTFLVFRDTHTGGVFFAHDAGCSCPVPFEDFTNLSQLTRVDPVHFDAFEQAVHSWNDEYGGGKVGSDEVVKFLRTVRGAVA